MIRRNLSNNGRQQVPVIPSESTMTHQSNDVCQTRRIPVITSEPKKITHQSDNDRFEKHDGFSTTTMGIRKERDYEAVSEISGREKLKRHQNEVAGRVWIPDIWGQEDLLKDWIDCSAFDSSLVPTGIRSARAALVEEGLRTSSGQLRIENRC